MNLPHLELKRSEDQYTADITNELMQSLLLAVDRGGPGWVLEVLALAVRKWHVCSFPTARIQRDEHIDAIESAAKMCHKITKARFRVESEYGFNPLSRLFCKALVESK